MRLEGNGTQRLTFRCEATTKDAVFVGGDNALYKLNTDGKLLKRYDVKQPPMPGGAIYDVCQREGKIYFIFEGSPRRGIAMLDPSTDKVSILAPSRPKAGSGVDPCGGVNRLCWDLVTPRLYACHYNYAWFAAPDLTCEFAWSPRNGAWQALKTASEVSRLVVSRDDETLLVRIVDNRPQFHFVEAERT